jgi:hypothetical protein
MRKTITISLATYKELDKARTMYSYNLGRTLAWDGFLMGIARFTIHKENSRIQKEIRRKKR